MSWSEEKTLIADRRDQSQAVQLTGHKRETPGPNCGKGRALQRGSTQLLVTNERRIHYPVWHG
jgi:hypothetical protein